ncbi:MAG: TRAP transporter substrate-binding protein DctP [Oscillospiraceae bacterium]|nr:TRAP transporter substrate-binding protein DctP [Oscillospiraceae bacterium]
MKLKKALALALALVMAFSLCACGSSSSTTTSSDSSSADTSSSGSSSASTSSETISLSLSHHDSSTSVIGTFLEDYAASINEASGGLLDVTVYAGAALAAPADGINALNSGVCDILWTCLGFFPGQFPVTELVTFPFNGLTSAVQGAYVMEDAWNTIEEVQAEWEAQGLHPLVLYTAPGSYLLSTNEVDEIADFQGNTYRCMAGIPTLMMEKLGATAVITPSGDIFTSMEKDIIQGTVFDMAGAKGFSLYDVTNYVMDVCLYEQVLVILMTEDRYQSLPAEAQEALDSVSGFDAALKHAELYEIDSDEYIAQFAEAGRMVEVSDEAMAEFEAVGEEVAEEWMASVDVENAAEIREEFQALIDKYSDYAN